MASTDFQIDCSKSIMFKVRIIPTPCQSGTCKVQCHKAVSCIKKTNGTRNYSLNIKDIISDNLERYVISQFIFLVQFIESN